MGNIYDEIEKFRGEMQNEIEKFWKGDGWKPNTALASTCHHCYCINIGMSTGRTVPHMQCCKCGDQRAAAGGITFG